MLAGKLIAGVIAEAEEVAKGSLNEGCSVHERSTGTRELYGEVCPESWKRKPEEVVCSSQQL